MSSGKHLSVEKYCWIKTSLAGNFDSSKDLETDREIKQIKLKVVLLIVCKESELSFAFSVLINY